MDILRERDQGGFGDRNEYGSRVGGGIDVSPWGGEARWGGPGWALGGYPGPYFTLCLLPRQVPVPRHSVGVVIGRSGEMIKKIQNDAGVRIQFKQGEEPPLTAWGWGGIWGDPSQHPQTHPRCVLGRRRHGPREDRPHHGPPRALRTRRPHHQRPAAEPAGTGAQPRGGGWGGQTPVMGKSPGWGGPKSQGVPRSQVGL